MSLAVSRRLVRRQEALATLAPAIVRLGWAGVNGPVRVRALGAPSLGECRTT